MSDPGVGGGGAVGMVSFIGLLFGAGGAGGGGIVLWGCVATTVGGGIGLGGGGGEITGGGGGVGRETGIGIEVIPWGGAGILSVLTRNGSATALREVREPFGVCTARATAVQQKTKPVIHTA